MGLAELQKYLDRYLKTAEIPDYEQAFNGLQVEGTRDIRKIVVAVDACRYTIDRTVELGGDMLLAHHGLFWGLTAPVTGQYYRRLEPLIKNGIALYSAHIPLDSHAEIGNNVLLAKELGLEIKGDFCEYKDRAVGVWCETQMSLDDLVEKVRQRLGVDPTVLAFGPETVKRVGLVSGGGGQEIGQAAASGLDTYITGEGAHHTFFEAEELGLNVIYAGHYATEIWGVRALGEHLAQKFDLEFFFVDHPTGL